MPLCLTLTPEEFARVVDIHGPTTAERSYAARWLASWRRANPHDRRSDFEVLTKVFTEVHAPQEVP